MKRLWLAAVLGALVLVMAVVPAAAADVAVQLRAQNNSGESGTAILSEMGPNQTKVTLNLTGAPANVAQPAHVHVGTCADLDPSPKYPLKSPENGKSETVLDVSLGTLTAGNLAINVHKSAAEAAVYVACGDIVTNTTVTAAQVAPKAGHAMSGATLPAVGAMLALAMAAVVGGTLLRRQAAR